MYKANPGQLAEGSWGMVAAWLLPPWLWMRAPLILGAGGRGLWVGRQLSGELPEVLVPLCLQMGASGAVSSTRRLRAPAARSSVRRATFYILCFRRRSHSIPGLRFW